MATIAIDWDDTLVDVHTQQWLPGALARIHCHLAAGDKVFVHTCRANWPEGRAHVELMLADAGLLIDVVAKPHADFYIDDKAQRPGEWLEMPVLGKQSPPSPRPSSKRRAQARVWR